MAFKQNQLEGDYIPASWHETLQSKIEKKVDMVNHPPHYEGVIPGIECIDVVEHMCYNRGAAMKYLWRAGHKDPDKEIEDLQKAAWYVNREIERLKKLQQKAKANG